MLCRFINICSAAVFWKEFADSLKRFRVLDWARTRTSPRTRALKRSGSSKAFLNLSAQWTLLNILVWWSRSLGTKSKDILLRRRQRFMISKNLVTNVFMFRRQSWRLKLDAKTQNKRNRHALFHHRSTISKRKVVFQTLIDGFKTRRDPHLWLGLRGPQTPLRKPVSSCRFVLTVWK